MKIADVFALVVPPERGVRFVAFDGSTAGPADAPITMELRTKRGGKS